MTIEVRFPGGRKVEAILDGRAVLTDQPAAAGGEGGGPSPFDLFLASIATCAGYYALRFCQERDLSTVGLKLTVETQWDAAHKRVERLRGAVELPEGFPERYREAILRSIDQCTVKRHLEHPPAVEFSVRSAPENPPSPAPR